MAQSEEPVTSTEYQEETDSVDARFRGEYSDETLELLRKRERPEWMEEEESLDPIDDMDEHARLNFRLPPTTYDALEAAAAEQVEELQQERDIQLPTEEAQLIKYRKQLVEGTSVDDVKWLKLRAYHRAMDKQRAEAEAAFTPDAQRQLMEAHGVPLDVVPQELIELTPEQLADRWQGAQAGSSLAHDIYSDESEWPADWATSSYLHNDEVRAQLSAAFIPQRNFRVGLSVRQPQPPAQQPLDEFGDLIDGVPANQPWQPIHEYTAEHLQEQAMERRLRAQQRQRALAFWVPLASVLGVYVVKGIRRLTKPKGGAKGAPKGAAQQVTA